MSPQLIIVHAFTGSLQTFTGYCRLLHDFANISSLEWTNFEVPRDFRHNMTIRTNEEKIGAFDHHVTKKKELNHLTNNYILNKYIKHIFSSSPFIALPL